MELCHGDSGLPTHDYPPKIGCLSVTLSVDQSPLPRNLCTEGTWVERVVGSVSSVFSTLRSIWGRLSAVPRPDLLSSMTAL